MLSAIIASDYVSALSVQRGLHNSHLKTLIYKADFANDSVNNFLYNDGFLIYLNDPEDYHIDFCKRFKDLSPDKNVFILVNTENLKIVNELKEYVDTPIFLSPFNYRQIVFLYKRGLSVVSPPTLTCQVNRKTLKLDHSSRQLYIDGDPQMDLVNKEFLLLEFLLSNQGKVVSKVDILESVWDRNLLGSTATIEVHVSRLRKKLRNRLFFDPIKTIPCVGYIFE
ncbi:winged helix-turn-helix transcriptional regulator [Candidatus Peregrinibacteria bacterium]|jgi:DNA-binding response OmpR family regulator|nr:winged helix-turn-helix transcriptional regulator [Candidatus Peregrinibacteria bacterium]MBT4055938.1 winged helix-turn-helix transcriptional regulator [Candidatus Peregrinibacteria bacterium]